MALPRPTTAVAPALVAPTTPEAIRDALVGPERAEFERQYREEMTAAAESLNLTGVLAVLAAWREIADMTQRQGGPAHERMLAVVQDLQLGNPVPTISAAQARASITARLAQ
ncbi:DUF6247 family protein [Nocardia pseudovaccinii]|uniref:DUF6247 family protein n=1 Tax=Nocardia pseudovaccinii TaxID=189540 RepID=UPI0012F4E1F8|nr:DUF6247 family protein [Nocardia pseudovaccinii]